MFKAESVYGQHPNRNTKEKNMKPQRKKNSDI